MKYTAGDFSQLLDISNVAIRKYEKYGLIHPERDAQSNYRTYTASDLSALLRARSYMEYGFTLKGSSELMIDGDLGDVAEQLSGKIEETKEKIAFYSRLLRHMQMQEDSLQRMSLNIEECQMTMRPAMYALTYRNGTDMEEDEGLREIVRTWNKWKPFSQAFITLDKETFGPQTNEYKIGLCIEEEFARELKIEENAYVKFYPSKVCVHGVSRCRNEADYEDEPLDLQFMFAYAEKKRLQLTGDCFGRILHTSRKSGEWWHYYELFAEVTSPCV